MPGETFTSSLDMDWRSLDWIGLGDYQGGSVDENAVLRTLQCTVSGMQCILHDKSCYILHVHCLLPCNGFKGLRCA